MSSYYGMKDDLVNKYDSSVQKQKIKELKKKMRKLKLKNLRKEKDPGRAQDQTVEGESDEDDNNEFEQQLKQAHVDGNLMKDKFLLQRYSKYLNKCMFIAQDDFIKKKFQAYVNKTNPKQGENFFQRMQKDQQRRVEKVALKNDRSKGNISGYYEGMTSTESFELISNRSKDKMKPNIHKLDQLDFKRENDSSAAVKDKDFFE